jgi:CheY-like chemotaxis protein
MLSLLRRLIGENITLKWQPGKDVWPVSADPTQLDQVLANLCINARDAIARTGVVTIETGNGVFDADHCATHPGFMPGDFAWLCVSDQGCGMDWETLAHVFEPFFTTKAQGKGTGLGLATVFGAVKQNGGFIIAASEPGLGSRFTLYLPRHLSQVASEDALPLPTSPTQRGHETILLVEDEREILELTKDILEKQGYTVLAAGSPGLAQRIAAEHAGEIHLLLTDVVMPEMNGRDLGLKLKAQRPDLKQLYMSGYTADIIARQGVIESGVHFIQKPFSMDALALKVREALV